MSHIAIFFLKRLAYKLIAVKFILFSTILSTSSRLTSIFWKLQIQINSKNNTLQNLFLSLTYASSSKKQISTAGFQIPAEIK